MRFTDELAHAAGRDPLDFLLDLIGNPRTIDFKGVEYPNYGASVDAYPWETGRLRHVTELVAEKSGWGKRKHSKGTGVGIAAHRSFLTYVATVVEVEVNDQGQVRIPRVDVALDAGLVVNPEATRAQFEGAAVFGTSVARTGEITATKGVIDQSNFQDYPVARINEVPAQTNVYIVDSDAPPAGVGEPGVPPFVAAFCNAIFCCNRQASEGSADHKARLKLIPGRLYDGEFNQPEKGKVMLRGKRNHSVICSSTILTGLVVTLMLLPTSMVRANPVPDSAATSATFRTKCAMCHGQDGSGSEVGKSMNVPDLRFPAVQKLSDSELAQAIANGKGGMPQFKNSLGEDQIHALVTYMRSIHPKK